MAPGRNAQGRNEWMYFKTNIGTPKTFQDAVNSMEACPAPAPAAGEQQGAATPAAPSKSSLEECSKLDTEGFSVCDSESEKNRMRNARRGDQTQATPGPLAPALPLTGDGSEPTPVPQRPIAPFAGEGSLID